MITSEHRDFVARYAPGQDIGGFSNLSKNDLSKASRLDFQYTGIYGELAWYLYRYGNLDKLQNLLEQKFRELRPQRKGDDGLDDIVTHNGKTRNIDIKSSYVPNVDKIQYLNLVVPEREYHPDMIYVGAFTVGSDRRNIDQVMLAGWCANEHITRRWKVDPKKFCVSVQDLRDLSVLKKIL